MRRILFRNLSVLGGILWAASAIASTFMPTPKTIDDCNGIFELSIMPDDNGMGIDRTCTVAVDDANCWTCTGGGSGIGTSSGSADNITTSEDTRLSHGVVDCVTVMN